ncbi:DNA polymerase I [Acholeplasma oculi]|uniref:DNA polymerase I n=1 Tax=Acholeplasma oculi TaxID=35623 RepID=A0A061AJJ1_9MOLU|nr:DNA polymerase I [Acholeplasma oculi]CDR31162.1 DNA polymerase I [Acholeplasma oculi]SKC37622.1 DNA polymerase I [Acholeplasma oculi]SUT90999.1 DNA polymerase I [Acholeplasma oculi]
MKHITLVDGNSILFRAYYATAYPGAKVLQTSSGIYTNAVFAFSGMIDKIIELSNSHMLIAFDTGEPTHRHLSYEGYKAGRKEMPEELGSQIPLIHELIKHLGIKEFSLPGYEADDIIGTLARLADESGYKVDVYSSDRDLLQLVNSNITVHLLKKGMQVVESYTPESLLERYGLSHEQFIDLKALMGDASDNIPGVPGVGEKTAVKLLQEYQTLENILENATQVKGKLGEKLVEFKEQALFSKVLSTIDTNTPLPFGLEATQRMDVLEDDLLNFYKRLELKQLVITYNKKNPTTNEDKPIKIEDFKVDLIEDEKTLESILKSDLSLYFELSTFNYHKADLWGIGLSTGSKHYFVSSELALGSPSFKDYLSNPSYKKSVYDYKAMKVFLKWKDLTLEGVDFDLLLAAYIVKSSIGKEDFTAVAQLFDINDLAYDEEIYGKGAKKGLPLISDLYESHIAKKAFIIHKLKAVTLNILKEREQTSLLNDVELPLSDVIADMEYQGLLVDPLELEEQTQAISQRISVLKEKILELAGVDFNIDSPKQLGDVLFEHLGLPNGKKTKTGYSTDIEVLNYLMDRHPIIEHIVNYRQLTKLYSTYLIGIKDSIFKDQKVHTIFNQALTLTGRLSSLEPNLQNIPIRTEEGRLIRKVFVPGEGNYLLGADYSQIELRVLADMANVKNLQTAFIEGEDIHTSTAKNVFHVDVVDSEQRRRAKAVNFGIIYGIGPWSLSEDIGVTVKEAESFITRYLEVYPEIKEYMTNIVEFAKTHGYVETILKRRRYIPELSSKVYALREFGKRTSLNAPIQGSAADIIKLAMIKLHAYLKDNQKQSKLILQVHDELILEVVPGELEEMKEVVPRIMQDAYPLKVSLKTSCDVGKTWYELK